MLYKLNPDSRPNTPTSIMVGSRRYLDLLDPRWDAPRGGYEVLVEGDTITDKDVAAVVQHAREEEFFELSEALQKRDEWKRIEREAEKLDELVGNVMTLSRLRTATAPRRDVDRANGPILRSVRCGRPARVCWLFWTSCSLIPGTALPR